MFSSSLVATGLVCGKAPGGGIGLPLAAGTTRGLSGDSRCIQWRAKRRHQTMTLPIAVHQASPVTDSRIQRVPGVKVKAGDVVKRPGNRMGGGVAASSARWYHPRGPSTPVNWSDEQVRSRSEFNWHYDQWHVHLCDNIFVRSRSGPQQANILLCREHDITQYPSLLVEASRRWVSKLCLTVHLDRRHWRRQSQMDDNRIHCGFPTACLARPSLKYMLLSYFRRSTFSCTYTHSDSIVVARGG